MKHLLGGAAIAALIAMGAPAMAQTSNDQQSAPAATPQEHATPESGATAPGKTGSAQHATRHRASKTAQASHKHRTAQDNMAEALNQQELQRLQQGGTMPQSGTSAPTSPPPTSPPKQ